jgi:hypothetical protein
VADDGGLEGDYSAAAREGGCDLRRHRDGHFAAGGWGSCAVNGGGGGGEDAETEGERERVI